MAEGLRGDGGRERAGGGRRCDGVDGGGASAVAVVGAVRGHQSVATGLWLADITAAQADLGPAQYGAAAQSTTNRQLLGAYHNVVLMEIEQLLVLSEDTAQWAAARFKDRSINFNKID